MKYIDENPKAKSVGVAILTLNAEKHLPRLLPPLLESPLKPHILIVDSSSTDDTLAIAKHYGVTVHTIDRASFDHGATREMARRLLGTDIVVMLTQDAYPQNSETLGRLVAPILRGEAAAAYGRQEAEGDASPLERFHRQFNYPTVSELRSIGDLKKYGKRLFFCSNSFAAYDNSALDAVGGFPSVLFGEDTLGAALLLRSGKKLAYVADAVVWHTHDNTLKQEFKRHFDIGYTRHLYGYLLDAPHGDKRRGSQYLMGLWRYLAKNSPSLLPYSCILAAAKISGYLLGRYADKLPRSLAKRLSSLPHKW